MNESEVGIIGLGPSGVTAAIYLNRYGMTPVCFEKELIGGQVNKTEKVENYTGVIDISGPKLGGILEEQLNFFNIKPIYDEVKEVKYENNIFIVKYGKDKIKEFKYLIVASGLKPNPFKIDGQDDFNSRGISRCAICDGPMYKGKDVVVVGAGNSAFEEANYLATICNSVSLIARREEFRAFPKVIDKFKEKNNTKIYAPYIIKKAKGTQIVEEIIIENVKNKEEINIKTNGIFLYVGEKADSSFISISSLDLDENGYIKVNDDMATNIENLYACGDVIKKELRQVSTAVSDGAKAASSIYLKYSN